MIHIRAISQCAISLSNKRAWMNFDWWLVRNSFPEKRGYRGQVLSIESGFPQEWGIISLVGNEDRRMSRLWVWSLAAIARAKISISTGSLEYATNKSAFLASSRCAGGFILITPKILWYVPWISSGIFRKAFSIPWPETWSEIALNWNWTQRNLSPYVRDVKGK